VGTLLSPGCEIDTISGVLIMYSLTLTSVRSCAQKLLVLTAFSSLFMQGCGNPQNFAQNPLTAATELETDKGICEAEDHGMTNPLQDTDDRHKLPVSFSFSKHDLQTYRDEDHSWFDDHEHRDKRFCGYRRHLNCSGEHCYVDYFRQPEDCQSDKLDIVFVVDSSGSMMDEKKLIASQIKEFVRELPGKLDINVGVIPAHGSKSASSGLVYRYNNEPTVLKLLKMSENDVSNALYNKLTHLPSDLYADGGEEGLYSLTRAISANLSSNRSQGIFRADAALAVVFVSDENDICARYPTGVQRVNDPENRELPALTRDCSSITPESVVAALRSIQDDRPLTVAGIVYTGESRVPPGGENEIGYGYVETIRLANGLAADLASKRIADALADIGKLVNSRLNLLKDFKLAQLAGKPVDQSTLKVTVDDRPVSFDFVSQTSEVHLTGYAGQAGSKIVVRYCVDKPHPTPTPTPCPTVTPKPTPTPTPVPPTPTPCPTTTPTATPTPTPTPRPPTPTPTPTPRPPTPTPTPTPRPPTPTPTPTPRPPTPTPTPTPRPPTPTPTPTPRPPTPTPTPTPRPPTPTPTPTPRPPTPTPTPTPVPPTPTPTPVPPTPTPTPTPTATPSPTPTPTPFVITQFRSEEVGDVYAIVTWQTNFASTSQVRVTNVATGVTVFTPVDPNFVFAHQLTIQGLEPLNVYELQAISVRSDGLTATSQINTIITSP
jgi:hypothetical protein